MKTILEKLSDARVFDIDFKKESNKIEFREGCDDFFFLELTKDEVKQLAAELLEYAK